jgi:hypothetical protein
MLDKRTIFRLSSVTTTVKYPVRHAKQLDLTPAAIIRGAGLTRFDGLQNFEHSNVSGFPGTRSWVGLTKTP